MRNAVLFRRFGSLNAHHRLFIALGFSIFCFFFLSQNISLASKVVISWDIFTYSMLLLIWIAISIGSPQQIRRIAQAQDDSNTLVFSMILLATCASLFAILLLLANQPAGISTSSLHTTISLLAIVGSWLLVHTIFTLRYAHLYYGDKPSSPSTHRAGLDFPEENQPDYLDFAYFSFVIGMTGQVSDVSITARPIRRLALLHGIISFGFNTVIVALTISTMASLL